MWLGVWHVWSLAECVAAGCMWMGVQYGCMYGVMGCVCVIWLGTCGACVACGWVCVWHVWLGTMAGCVCVEHGWVCAHVTGRVACVAGRMCLGVWHVGVWGM